MGAGLAYATRTQKRATMPQLSAQTPPLETGDALSKNAAFDDQAARVLRQFRLIFSTIRRHFQTMEKQSGIGGAQVWALSLVAQHPGLGVTRLADLMDIHQSTTSNLVKSLIKSGLLHSEKSVHDRRVVELYVLPEGLKLLKKIPGSIKLPIIVKADLVVISLSSFSWKSLTVWYKTMTTTSLKSPSPKIME